MKIRKQIGLLTNLSGGMASGGKGEEKDGGKEKRCGDRSKKEEVKEGRGGEYDEDKEAKGMRGRMAGEEESIDIWEKE